jgi:anti-anti-sigma factor
MYSAIGQDAGQLVCRDVVISPGTASSVQLCGELDRNTASRLEQLLDRLRCDGYRQVFLDLSGLEFLSAAGLTVFLRADHALSAVGGRLVLSWPTPMARRVLAIAELDTTLSIQPAGTTLLATIV